MNPTDKFKHCNHHHELTNDYEIVDFGTGEFVANKDAVPILKSLNQLGLTTRTHHIEKGKQSFISVIIDPDMSIEIKTVNERDSTRTQFNGKQELLIIWQAK